MAPTLWYGIKQNFSTLNKDEITSLKAKIMKITNYVYGHFDKTLETIDENYTFSLSPKLILALLILIGMIFVVFGILFIWYKRKTALATSTVRQLHKLIPLVKEQKLFLNSLLPSLSEIIHPTKSTNLETANVAAGSQQSPTCDEHSITAMVPHHCTTSNKSKMATPTTTPTETEPISLELFNCAAADLDANGEIQLREY